MKIKYFLPLLIIVAAIAFLGFNIFKPIKPDPISSYLPISRKDSLTLSLVSGKTVKKDSFNKDELKIIWDGLNNMIPVDYEKGETTYSGMWTELLFEGEDNKAKITFDAPYAFVVINGDARCGKYFAFETEFLIRLREIISGDAV